MLLAVLASSCTAGSVTVAFVDPRPIDEAIQKLESEYGWPITYEEPPWVFGGDLIDVTAQVRRDGKSASEPGIKQILVPRSLSLFVELEERLRQEPGTRAPEAEARAAIQAVLKSYSGLVGGVEMFTLTDSDGVFHIIPTLRKNEAGRLERAAPVLDMLVDIPPGERTFYELVIAVCQSVSSQTGYRIDGAPNTSPSGNRNALRTAIASRPGESARSILSRVFAEFAMPQPVSWSLLHESGWGYALNVRVVNTSVRP